MSLLIAVLWNGSASSEDVYSPGGWSTLHRSGANRKLVRNVPLAEDYAVWTALAGASVLTAPTLSPDGKTLYVTTGQARGAHNLHAFSIEGELRWRAAAFVSPNEGVDPCAILSSPIVDSAGDVYVSDCNQLFAHRPDGSLKWVADLPAPRAEDWKPSEALVVNAFTTAVFTRRGHVLGVTNFGDVVVVDRATGASVAEPMRLPGLLPRHSSIPMPETLFGEGLVDPEIRDWSWQLLFGGAMRSANTPAVDPDSGRIHVAATSTKEGLGALYGLDLVASDSGLLRVEIAFATDMGPGSGSSPSLSPELSRVYVSDETGIFYSVDAQNGEIHWQVETKSASAAAAVGADGVIYSLQAYGPALVAIEPSGEIKWQSDFEALAAARLPASWLLGDPVAIGNGNPTVVDDVVLVPVIYGYRTTIGRSIPWLVESSLVAVDTSTGKGIRDVVSLEDDSTGVTGILPDGTILNSLGTAMTSGAAGLQYFEALLPGDRQILRPVGGIQVSRPR